MNPINDPTTASQPWQDLYRASMAQMRQRYTAQLKEAVDRYEGARRVADLSKDPDDFEFASQRLRELDALCQHEYIQVGHWTGDPTRSTEQCKICGCEPH
jgi:hypothetical protein